MRMLATSDATRSIILENASMDLSPFLSHPPKDGSLPHLIPLIIEQTLCGLQQLHRGGFSHRDLNARNILLVADQGKENYVIKIADFGRASNRLDTVAQEKSRDLQHVGELIIL